MSRRRSTVPDVATWVPNEDWANRLQRLIELRGWTVREAAAHLRVAPSTISNITAGRLPSIRLRHAIRVFEQAHSATAPPPPPRLHVRFDSTGDVYVCSLAIVVEPDCPIAVATGVGRTASLAVWSAWRELPAARRRAALEPPVYPR